MLHSRGGARAKHGKPRKHKQSKALGLTKGLQALCNWSICIVQNWMLFRGVDRRQYVGNWITIERWLRAISDCEGQKGWDCDCFFWSHSMVSCFAGISAEDAHVVRESWLLVHVLNDIQTSSDRSSWHSNCVVKALGLQYVNDAYVVFYLSAYCPGPTIWDRNIKLWPVNELRPVAVQNTDILTMKPSLLSFFITHGRQYGVKHKSCFIWLVKARGRQWVLKARGR